MTARASWCARRSGQLGARAQRRRGLRAAGHHDRAQPRRLLPRQQDEAQDRWPSRPPTRRSRPTTPAAATPTPPTPRASAGERLQLANPDDHIVLPEIISKEPLGPAVRQGDDQWFDIVQWTHFAMVNAEELGVTQANVDEQMKSDNPDIKRLLGIEGKYRRGARPDQRLGLPHHQARRQLRRDLRAQCRPGLAAEDRARPQRAVDQGRPAIRAADPLSVPASGLRDGSP